MQENDRQTVSDEMLAAALSDTARCAPLVYADEALCNEIIERYLAELAGTPQVPSVRGYAALTPIPKPKTLAQAKRIVDGNL